MTPKDIPREVRWTVPLALVGLALAVPFSAPAGTGWPCCESTNQIELNPASRSCDNR